MRKKSGSPRKVSSRWAWLVKLWRKLFPERVTLLLTNGRTRRVTRQQIIEKLFRAALQTARQPKFYESGELGLVVNATLDLSIDGYYRWQQSKGVSSKQVQSFPWIIELRQVANEAVSVMTSFFYGNPPPLGDESKMTKWRETWTACVIPRLIKLGQKYGLKLE